MGSRFLAVPGLRTTSASDSGSWGWAAAGSWPFGPCLHKEGREGRCSDTTENPSTAVSEHVPVCPPRLLRQIPLRINLLRDHPGRL
jgi:hypothetical protein